MVAFARYALPAINLRTGTGHRYQDTEDLLRRSRFSRGNTRDSGYLNPRFRPLDHGVLQFLNPSAWFCSVAKRLRSSRMLGRWRCEGPWCLSSQQHHFIPLLAIAQEPGSQPLDQTCQSRVAVCDAVLIMRSFPPQTQMQDTWRIGCKRRNQSHREASLYICTKHSAAH